jgi:hypothetical protein
MENLPTAPPTLFEKLSALAAFVAREQVVARANLDVMGGLLC